MKIDINDILNKLVSYAFDNLLLDIPDAQYTLNRLAVACGYGAPALDENADYGDGTLGSLLDKLAEAAPATDKAAVLEALFPMPRTVNQYFENRLDRDPDKAFDFLFDLYEKGGLLAEGEALRSEGYVLYTAGGDAEDRPASLSVGEQLAYTPVARANRIATLKNPDLLADDTIAREVSYAIAYGGGIAARVGGASDYYCCKNMAVSSAPIKKQLSGGSVKISLLDYPVPAFVFNGIAKNAVIRESSRVVKAAIAAEIPCVVAAEAKDGTTVYVVFAKPIDKSDFVFADGVLSACGVFRTADCRALLPVLEKGTALSTDLAEFKPLYDKIGGVKLGAAARDKLAAALCKRCVAALKAAASADENAAEALITQ